MKKKIIAITVSILIVGIIVAIYFIFPSADKVICTVEQEDSFRNTEIKFIIRHEEDKVISVTEISDSNFKTHKLMESLQVSLDASYNKLKKNKDIEIKKSVKDLNYKTTVNVDVNKLNDESIESLKLSRSLKEMKNNLVTRGFSCR